MIGTALYNVISIESRPLGKEQPRWHMLKGKSLQA